MLLRQPMAALKGKMAVSLVLNADPQTLDRKLGQLLWTGQYLLDKGCGFEICCVTGRGLSRLPVNDATGLQKAMDTLLRSPVAAADAVMPRLVDVSWQHHIGADAYET